MLRITLHSPVLSQDRVGGKERLAAHPGVPPRERTFQIPAPRLQEAGEAVKQLAKRAIGNTDALLAQKAAAGAPIGQRPSRQLVLQVFVLGKSQPIYSTAAFPEELWGDLGEAIDAMAAEFQSAPWGAANATAEAARPAPAGIVGKR